MAQQQWEADQRLRVEATTILVQTSTQLNAEFTRNGVRRHSRDGRVKQNPNAGVRNQS